MKSLFKTIVPLLGLGSADQFLEVTDAPTEAMLKHESLFFTPQKTRFGNNVEGVRYDKELRVTEKNVFLGGDSNDIYFDYEQQHAHLKDLTSYLKGEKQHISASLGVDLPKNCHSHIVKPYFPDDPTDQFMFAPAFTGQLKLNQPVTHEGNCFEETTFELVKDPSDAMKYQVKVTLKKARTYTCSDFYLFGNSEVLHPEEFFFSGTHYLNFIA
jgi:hypothetical protein